MIVVSMDELAQPPRTPHSAPPPCDAGRSTALGVLLRPGAEYRTRGLRTPVGRSTALKPRRGPRSARTAVKRLRRKAVLRGVPLRNGPATLQA